MGPEKMTPMGRANILLITILSSLALPMLPAARGQDEPGGDPNAAALEALKVSAERFIEAFNRADAAEVAETCLPGGEITLQDGTVLAGREAIPLEKLEGERVVDKGEKGVVTLTMLADGKFSWDYTRDGESEGFSGEFSMNDDGLLVLDAEDTQMVATVAMTEANALKFIIAGGPPGDPGLNFKKAG